MRKRGQRPGMRSAGARLGAGALRELQGRTARRLLVQGPRGVPVLQREAGACDGGAPGGAGAAARALPAVDAVLSATVSSCRGRAACAWRRCRRPRPAPSPKAAPVRLAGRLLPACQDAPACQRQAGAGAAVPLWGAWRAGAGAPVANGGGPHRLAHEAPAAGRHHAPALHRAGTVTACGVPGTSASGKPHEVPRRLCSRRAIAAISAPPSGSGGGERGAPGSGQQGADKGEDAARRLSPSCSAGRSTSTCSPA
jgi:hypothetical protein